LTESDFTRQEFIDRLGSRTQHLVALTAILQQLGSPLSQPTAARENR